MHRTQLLRFVGISILLITVLVSTSEARQFRKMAPIPVAPDVLGSKDVLNTSQANAMLEPIDPAFIVKEVEKIVASWNTAGLVDYLDRAFPSRWQLVDVLGRDIPVDAQLQLLNVQNISTLSQNWLNTTPSQRQRESNVVATVNLQIRFIDARKGLITLPHTSQLYLRVVESE